jgi:hypothetical protein
MTLELNRALAEALGYKTIVPRYDTLPDAVFAQAGLIDEMMARGFYVALMWQVPYTETDPWCASFERLGADEEWIAYGSSPMEAIARAALAAITRKEAGVG